RISNKGTSDSGQFTLKIKNELGLITQKDIENLKKEESQDIVLEIEKGYKEFFVVLDEEDYVEEKNEENNSLYFFYEIFEKSGDLNGDNEIDIIDVILCLRQAIGLDETNFIFADINKDGEIDISDVILILRKAIGLI
ncbi:MAG: dockerin type I repeat-containing protein, partial [bacterium]|nr:dockerin type I repeat-containing protein [bacterium]MDW8163359.1 dockerin type I repeat-containing protein [Candidatus Omnitrophota bacterium]